MTVLVYLIPIVSCLLLKVVFDYTGEWYRFLTFLLVGEAFVGLLNWIFYYFRTHATEYLGALVKSIHYEAPWVELRTRTVTRTDSNGKTYTSTVVDHIRHPERYYFHTTGRRNPDGGKECSADFFRYVHGRWGLPLQPWSIRRGNIKGGVRYGSEAAMDFYGDWTVCDDPRWVSVTETHRYKNKIRNSDSIFKLRKIPRKEAEELGLFEYPKKIHNFDIPCIMTQTLDVPLHVQEKFRRFNGAFAPRREMRLFILVFDSTRHSSAVAEMQRTYWQGGNMNEFTVCLGVDPATGIVDWATAFSWTEPATVANEVGAWFRPGERLDWDAFYDWFLIAHQGWERRDFGKDFRYLQVRLSLWQILTMMALSILENAIYIHFLLT